MVRFWIKKCFKSWLRLTAGLVAIIFLFTTVSAPFVQASFWEERRKASEDIQRKGKPLQIASIMGVVPDLGSSRVPASQVSIGSDSLRDLLQKVQSPQSLSSSNHNIPIQRGLPEGLVQSIQSYGDIERIHLAKGQSVIMKGQDNKPKLALLKLESPLIILVQDAHGIYTVQKNIAHLVKKFMDLGVNLVGVEGASGKIEGLENLKGFPDKESLMGVAGYLMEKGLLTGVEVAGLSSNIADYIGVEEKEKYLEQVQSFKDTLNSRKEVERWSKEILQRIASLKEIVYPPELKELDRFKQDYEKGNKKLGEWLLFLAKDSQTLDPNTNKYIKAYKLESAIDFKEVESEQKNLLFKLSAKLNSQELAQLLRESLAYRLGKIGYGDFYSRIEKRCDKAKVAIPSELGKYIKYAVSVDGIEKDKLFQEVSQLETSAWNSRIANSKSRKLYEIDKDYRLLGKAIDFRLSPQDWNEYSKREKEIQTLGQRIEWMDKEGVLVASLPVLKVLRNVSKFNELSHQRNNIFVEKLSSHLLASHSQIAVLVAGGYHSKGVEKLLGETGISYITIRPYMNTADISGDYNPLNAFKRDLLPLEKMFLPEKITLAPPLATANVSSVQGKTVEGILKAVPAVLDKIKGKQNGGAVLKEEKWIKAGKVLSGVVSGVRVIGSDEGDIAQLKAVLQKTTDINLNGIEFGQENNLYSTAKGQVFGITMAKPSIKDYIFGMVTPLLLGAAWTPNSETAFLVLNGFVFMAGAIYTIRFLNQRYSQISKISHIENLIRKRKVASAFFEANLLSAKIKSAWEYKRFSILYDKIARSFIAGEDLTHTSQAFKHSIEMAQKYLKLKAPHKITSFIREKEFGFLLKGLVSTSMIGLLFSEASKDEEARQFETYAILGKEFLRHDMLYGKADRAFRLSMEMAAKAKEENPYLLILEEILDEGTGQSVPYLVDLFEEISFSTGVRAEAAIGFGEALYKEGLFSESLQFFKMAENSIDRLKDENIRSGYYDLLASSLVGLYSLEEARQILTDLGEVEVIIDGFDIRMLDEAAKIAAKRSPNYLRTVSHPLYETMLETVEKKLNSVSRVLTQNRKTFSLKNMSLLTMTAFTFPFTMGAAPGSGTVQSLLLGLSITALFMGIPALFLLRKHLDAGLLEESEKNYESLEDVENELRLLPYELKGAVRKRKLMQSYLTNSIQKRMGAEDSLRSNREELNELVGFISILQKMDPKKGTRAMKQLFGNRVSFVPVRTNLLSVFEKKYPAGILGNMSLSEEEIKNLKAKYINGYALAEWSEEMMRQKSADVSEIKGIQVVDVNAWFEKGKNFSHRAKMVEQSIRALGNSSQPIAVVADQGRTSILLEVNHRFGNSMPMDKIIIIDKDQLPNSTATKMKIQDVYNALKSEPLSNIGIYILTDLANRWDSMSNSDWRIQVYQLVTSTLAKPVLSLREITEDIKQAHLIKIQA